MSDHRRVSRRLTVTCLAFAVSLSFVWAGTARAQVSAQDRSCIATFNKSVWKIARTQAGIVDKCLRDVAAGTMAPNVAELCLQSDPAGKLDKAVVKAVAKTNAACAHGLPAFGAVPVHDGLGRAALTAIDTMHGAISGDLDTGLLGGQPVAASCQARVAATLLKCQDTRIRAFVKCQKKALAAGIVTDAATLEAQCLGVGAEAQPGSAKIGVDCGDKIVKEIGRRCASTNLVQAFPACGTNDAGVLAACVSSEPACQACRLLNEVDGLARDCDLFDDGNGANGSCDAECGDGVPQTGESCDDGGTSGGDGCSTSCNVEGGWSCTGAPSVCTPNCGNGALDGGETCDDGGAADGDGCDAACIVEEGWSCAGEPSVCAPLCGNGVVQASEGEVCDDGDANDGDGCSNECRLEEGWACSGQPSICTFVCGNQSFNPHETCDDGNASAGDGCSAVCKIEPGWLCVGLPSVCTPRCGDGLLRGAESCDDDGVTSGDGCSFTCQAEAGFTCEGEPSNCIPICGDGFVRGTENCDDGNTSGGDGCSPDFCLREIGFECLGQPSLCAPSCGDADLDPLEECDDGNLATNDGCDADCIPEAGYACGGEPSVCALTCGNGVLDGAEGCDDGDVIAGDGCSPSCRNESGWLCSSPGLPCLPFDLFVDSPAHGIFTTAPSVVVTGHYSALPPGQAAVTINGVPASSLDQMTRTFSHTLTLDQAAVLNPIRVTLTNTANGDDLHDRLVVVAGQSVADGALSPQSVAMRVNDSGLDEIEPLVAALAGDQLDLATILPSGTVLIDDCFINVIGCWGSAKVKIGSPPPSFSNFTLGMDSKPNAVFGDIDIANLRVDVEIDGSGLVPDCGLRLTATGMQISGDFALQPEPTAPTQVDVNLAGTMGVQFTGFNHTFTYGLCNAPIIGGIIQSLLPDIQQVATDGIRGFLADPDAGGPQDSPIAEAIETTLGGISVSGAVGSGLGLMLDAPLFAVNEDNTGLTLGAGASFTVSVGNGPGQCIPPPGAPDLAASYSKSETFPTFGPNTPVGNTPYDFGISISTAGFNQLLRGQTECGLMRSSLTTIDLDGPGGVDPVGITAGLLALLVPEFSALPSGTPLRIDVAPTMAPIVTGNPGPGGELAELKIAQVAISVVEPGPETVWLGGVLDVRLGMALAFLPDGSGLAITLATPALADLAVVVVYNPLGASEANVETVLPSVVRPLIPDLAGALGGFPLPQFFGLTLEGVEVSKNGEFFSLFADLSSTP